MGRNFDTRYAHQRHNSGYNNGARAHNRRLLAYHRAHNPRTKKSYVRPVDIATGVVPRDVGGAKIALRDVPASEAQLRAVQARGQVNMHVVYDRLNRAYGVGITPQMTHLQKEEMWRVHLGIAR